MFVFAWVKQMLKQPKDSRKWLTGIFTFFQTRNLYEEMKLTTSRYLPATFAEGYDFEATLGEVDESDDSSKDEKMEDVQHPSGDVHGVSKDNTAAEPTLAGQGNDQSKAYEW